MLTRIIRRAGVPAWPKLFHNLRASRETELAAEYPIHVVCAWVGHTVQIAAKHYLTVREEDFQRAAEGGTDSGAPVARIAAQQGAAMNGKVEKLASEPVEDCNSMQRGASRNLFVRKDLVPPRGVEPLFSD